MSAAPSTAAAAARGHVALVALCALASRPRHHSLQAPPPSPPLVPPAQPAAPGSVGFGLVSWLVSAASATASANAATATAALGVPPARPPHRQPASGMGSVSGRSGRAWTPLRVECRGVALRGAHYLQPGCNVLCPPVAPCRYLGTITACALCHIRLARLCIARCGLGEGGGLECRAFAGFRRTLLDGSPQRARTTVSGWPLQHGQPVSLMLWERGLPLPPLRAGGVRCSPDRPCWARRLPGLASGRVRWAPLRGCARTAWVACARMEPLPFFLLLSACTCIAASMLHHVSIDPLSISEGVETERASAAACMAS